MEDIKKLVANAAEKFRQEHAAKSYSQRHPELGKMINCQFCSRRHRSIIVCSQNILTPVPNTKRGVNGSQAFAKKRLRPHTNKKNLLLIGLTRKLFNNHLKRFPHPEDAMQSARAEAKTMLLQSYRADRRIKNNRQKISRRLNRGL